MRKIDFILLLLIGFLYSCSTDMSITDNAFSEDLETRKRTCLSVTQLENSTTDCCVFKLCAAGQPGLFEHWYLLGFPQEPTIGKQTCWVVETCEDTTVTLVKEKGDTSYVCDVDLVCDTTPEEVDCCESICFDFSYEMTDENCYTIEITMEGDDECFPYGIRFKNGILTYYGDNGELGDPLIKEGGVCYEFCQYNPFPIDEIFGGEVTIAGCEFNFVFDLFGEEPVPGQCSPVVD